MRGRSRRVRFAETGEEDDEVPMLESSDDEGAAQKDEEKDTDEDDADEDVDEMLLNAFPKVVEKL
eukprot:959257-Karenia_brevis.AAC.1